MFLTKAATVAAGEMSELRVRIQKLLAGDVPLDSDSKAHLRDTANRIEKILDARFTLHGSDVV